MKANEQKPYIFIKSVTLALICSLGVTASPLSAASVPAPAGENAWQTRSLFEPSQNQRQLEERGRIMIYDGLRDLTIERVLDSQFDRIQNMMFTRIIRTDNTGNPLRDSKGQVLVEDDGC